LPSTSHPCHYTDHTVLAVSLLAKERNNVHAVELEVLTAALKSGTEKTPAEFIKYNLETHFEDVVTGMIPCSSRQYTPFTYTELLAHNTASHPRRLEYLATAL